MYYFHDTLNEGSHIFVLLILNADSLQIVHQLAMLTLLVHFEHVDFYSAILKTVWLLCKRCLVVKIWLFFFLSDITGWIWRVQCTHWHTRGHQPSDQGISWWNYMGVSQTLHFSYIKLSIAEIYYVYTGEISIAEIIIIYCIYTGEMFVLLNHSSSFPPDSGDCWQPTTLIAAPSTCWPAGAWM